jgi:hypothetical protein
MEPAAGLAPAEADVNARRFRLASPATALVLSALALVLAAIAVPLAGLTILNIGSDLLELVFAGVGLVVARRQPRNPIGWILLIFIVMALLGDDAGAYAVLVYSHGHRGLPLAPVAVLLAPLGYLAIPVFPLIILLFPDGRLASRRWRWVLWAYAVLVAFFAALAAAALFNPVRRRVQQMVDRRFNRARYDANQTIALFAGRLKDTVDLDSVRDDLASVVHQALEPVHVSVWISQRD